MIRYVVNGDLKCWLWHSWTPVFGTGITTYFSCTHCDSRKVEQSIHGGYQPMDWDWLEGLTNKIKDAE